MHDFPFVMVFAEKTRYAGKGSVPALCSFVTIRHPMTRRRCRADGSRHQVSDPKRFSCLRLHLSRGVLPVVEDTQTKASTTVWRTRFTCASPHRVVKRHAAHDFGETAPLDQTVLRLTVNRNVCRFCYSNQPDA